VFYDDFRRDLQYSALVKLDKIDRLLLDLVQRNAWMTAEAMAQRVPLSASAIQRRLKRLSDSRVITGANGVVDPSKIGRPMFLVVSLEVERERPELLTRLRTWLAESDAVQQAFYATGSADFILIMTAPNPESFDVFMSKLIAENPNVKRFATNVVLNVIKRSLFVPVPGDDEADWSDLAQR
jgi:DNA-binding Lrp family transcriptional regulator